MGATCANYLATYLLCQPAGLLLFRGYIDLTGVSSWFNYATLVLHMAGVLDGGLERSCSTLDSPSRGVGGVGSPTERWRGSLSMLIHVLPGDDHSDFCSGFFVT